MPQTVDRKTVRSWTEELEAVDERLWAHFSRSEVRQRARDYLRGLLSSAERKNGWQLAEEAGDATPYGPMVSSICSEGRIGTRTPSETT